MSIALNHIPYNDFIENEMATLKFLQDSTEIAKIFPSLATQAFIFFNLNKSKKEIIDFVFRCDLELVVEKRRNSKKDKKRIVLVEVLLKPDYAESVYSISICNKKRGKHTVIRKFHFDYAPVVSMKDNKPIYHLQYGGKPTPGLNDLKVNCSNLLTWLSSPRLNFLPVNLALILDMILCEFPSIDTITITENDEWRKMMKKNEELVSKNYFMRVFEFFDKKHTPQTLYRDFYYGKI